MSSTGPPSRHRPSAVCRVSRTLGSSARNVASAASRPNTAPGCFCVMRARARVPGGTVAAVVTSPVPTSSASARATIAFRSMTGTLRDRPGRLEHDLAVAGPVAAVLLDPVASRAAVDDVCAAADRADRVVAGPGEDPVAPEAADERVAAVAADQRVVAAAALDRVGAETAGEAIVPGPAEEGVHAPAADQPVVAARALEEVVAAAPGQPVAAVRADDALVGVGAPAARVAQ